MTLPEPAESWTVTVLSPEDRLGTTSYQLNLDRCSMTISYPMVAPELLVFHVTCDEQDSGIHWAGDIDARGQILHPTLDERAPQAGLSTDLPSVGASTPVVGWPGYLRLSLDPRYDDMVVLSPRGQARSGSRVPMIRLRPG